MVSNILFPVGGVETYMIALGEQLQKNGHIVDYFGMEDERNLLSNTFDIYASNIDLNRRSFKSLLYPLRVIYSLQTKKRFKSLLKKIKPDIIHLNTINYNLTPSIVYAASKLKIAMIKTVHDAQIICPNHRLFIESQQKPCMKCLGGKFHNCTINKCINDSRFKSLLGSIESYLYHNLKTYKKINKYIFPSKFMQELHINQGIDESQAEYLVNFSRLSIPLNKNKSIIKQNYVLYFGRISIEKGILTLLKVIKRNPEIKFIFIGKGSLSNRLNDYNNIEYLGFKQGEELIEIVQNAKFTVYPSEWYENSPLSVLESQALGTPVIGANIGGIPELISSNTGLLFESGNVDDLELKIKNLYFNEELLDDLTKNCLENSEIMNVQQYTEKIEKIYRKVMHNL